MKLDGEIALLAGGTSGIGLATAGKEASIVLTTFFLNVSARRACRSFPPPRRQCARSPDRSAPSWHTRSPGQRGEPRPDQHPLAGKRA
jgi:hypothetical protein